MSGSFGHRLSTTWVRFYTRQLPNEAAERRREELASDLWEHTADAKRRGQRRWVHEFEVIGRVLSGLPADLSWRRGILRSLRRPESGAPMPTTTYSTRSSSLVLTALAVVGIAIGTTSIPIAVSFADEMSGADFLWPALVMTFTTLLCVGLALLTARPQAATALLTIGAAAPALAWFWLPPVYLLTAAIAITAVATRRRRRPVRRSS